MNDYKDGSGTDAIKFDRYNGCYTGMRVGFPKPVGKGLVFTGLGFPKMYAEVGFGAVWRFAFIQVYPTFKKSNFSILAALVPLETSRVAR